MVQLQDRPYNGQYVALFHEQCHRGDRDDPDHAGSFSDGNVRADASYLETAQDHEQVFHARADDSDPRVDRPGVRYAVPDEYAQHILGADHSVRRVLPGHGHPGLCRVYE